MARSSQYPPSVDPGVPREWAVPRGWRRERLRDLVHVVERPVDLCDSDEYQLVIAKRSRGGIVPRERLPGSAIRVRNQYRVEAGDFLMSARQIIHGACGVVPSELAGAIVSNEYVVVRPADGLVTEYLAQLSHTPYFQRTCFHSSIGIDVEKMVFKVDRWLNYHVAVPPVSEQREIAAALKTADDAISAGEEVVEQLDRVRRNLREALIAGAGGKDLSVGDLLDDGPRNGVYKPADKIGRGSLIAGMTAIQDAGIDWRLCRRAEATPEELIRFGLHQDDLLVTRVYARLDGVGRFIRVAEPPEPAVYESNMMRIRVRRDLVLPEFLAEAMASRSGRHQIDQRATLAAQASLNSESLRSIRLRVPSLVEQQRVVGALDAVANRLDVERAVIAEHRRLKGALADALLTGKIRVRVPDDAAPEHAPAKGSA